MVIKDKLYDDHFSSLRHLVMTSYRHNDFFALRYLSFFFVNLAISIVCD